MKYMYKGKILSLNLKTKDIRSMAGIKHFLQDFTLIYPILPKFIKNDQILRKILSNSHPCTINCAILIIQAKQLEINYSEF